MIEVRANGGRHGIAEKLRSLAEFILHTKSAEEEDVEGSVFVLLRKLTEKE